MAAEQIQLQLSRLNLPEEQMRNVSRYMQVPDQMRFVLTGAAGGAVALGIGWVLWATVLHFSILALGGESQYSRTFSVVAWSWGPFFLRNLVQAACIGLYGQAIVNPGLSALVATGDVLRDSTNVWWVFLSSVDIYLLWLLLLLTIGISTASGFSRLKSATTAMIWWAVSKGLGLIPTLLGGALMSGLMGR